MAVWIMLKACYFSVLKRPKALLRAMGSKEFNLTLSDFAGEDGSGPPPMP